MDRFWINTWIFFAVVTVLASLMMGELFLLDNAAQNSDEASIEEKEAIHGIIEELWKEFRFLVPMALVILFATAISYIIYKKEYVNVLEGEKDV